MKRHAEFIDDALHGVHERFGVVLLLPFLIEQNLVHREFASAGDDRLPQVPSTILCGERRGIRPRQFGGCVRDRGTPRRDRRPFEIKKRKEAAADPLRVSTPDTTMRRIMRLPTFVALVVLCSAGASVQSQAPQSGLPLSRMAATGKLWATVKYFHPSLSESNPAPWDSALLDAIPRVQAAKTAEEFAAALTAMLGSLKDPVTRVEKAEPDPPFGGFGFASVEIRDGVLIVTSGDTGGDPLDSGDRVARRLPDAKGVIFDLRPGPVHPWLWDPRGIPLSSQAISYPAQRFRVHAGLVTPRGAEGVPYFSGSLTRAAALSVPPASGTRDLPVVFLVRASEQIPFLAPALQSTGTGYIIAEQPVDDRNFARHGYARHYRMPLTDGLTAVVRTSEMINSDGTVGLFADRVVSHEDALAVAFAALAGKISRVARRPSGAPVYQVKHPELAYAESRYPTEPLRLLGAFRIWSVFEWFSPYRHLMDPGWDTVLEEALSKFSAARNAQEYHLAVAEMVSHVDDTHSETSSTVMTEFWGVAAPALSLRPVEGKAVVVGITDESVRSSEIRAGDVIVSVDGETTEARLSRISRYISASTPQALRRDAVSRLLRGSNNSMARVRVAKADGSERDVQLERQSAFLTGTMNPPGGEVFRLLSGNIGYIDLRLLKNHEVDRVFDALKNTVGLVFDMRGYPNNTRYAVARKLVAKPETIKTVWPYVRVLFEPGTETRQDLLQAAQPIEPSSTPYRGRTVMLIDDRAQSQSEETAEVLKAVHGTIFVGSPTAGANGEGSNFFVPGGLTVGLTGIGVIRADGTTMQRVGQKPDVFVLPTLAGIRSGRDEVLERGIVYLTNGSR